MMKRHHALIGRWFRSLMLGIAPGALVLATPASAVAQDVAATPAERQMAEARLASALTRIAANRDDAAALHDGGLAALAIGDAVTAERLLAQAAGLMPGNGAVHGALGAALVQLERPEEAMAAFARAEQAGGDPAAFLAERALAYDLTGDQVAAQRDYERALGRRSDPVTVRNLALSLGVSGAVDRAVELLGPQLRAKDRAAWRMRAMIYAINGRHDEARDIVRATMPAPLAASILPFLATMDQMSPAQQVAAAHFGTMPDVLGPVRKPVRMADAALGVPPSPASARPERVSARAAARSDRPTPPPAARRAPATAPVQQPKAVAPPVPASAPATVAAPPLVPAPAPAPPPVAAPASTLPAATPVPVQQASMPSVPVRPAQGPVDEGNAAPGALASVAPVTRSPTVSTSVIVPPVTAPAAGPSASARSLADIVAGLDTAAEAETVPPGALDAAALERLRQERVAALRVERARLAREEAAAKAKAEAEAKARAEAEKKRAHPARAWVQIATGADPAALAFDFRRLSRQHDAMQGQKGATAPWGRTRRLVVGPFKDAAAARAWLASYKAGGGDGFIWTSSAGEEVTPLR